MKIGLTDTMIITGLTVTDTLFLFFTDTVALFLILRTRTRSTDTLFITEGTDETKISL